MTATVTANRTEHAPTPWTYETGGGDDFYIWSDAADECIAKMCIDEKNEPAESGIDRREANAEFLTRAANAHDDLLAALQGAVEQLTGPAMVYGDGRGNDGKKTGLSHAEFNALRRARLDAARAAIAKATAS